jgi:hypothetical protein
MKTNVSSNARPHPGLLPLGEGETDPAVVFSMKAWIDYCVLE